MDFVHILEDIGININVINIGGGLPASYDQDEDPEEFSFKNYRKALEASIPELFSGKYEIHTEFGRSLLLKAGTTLSKVEFVKHWIQDIHPIILTHVGANQYFTHIYWPNVWTHRFAIANENGVEKKEPSKTFDIAGPLCFQVKSGLNRA